MSALHEPDTAFLVADHQPTKSDVVRAIEFEHPTQSVHRATAAFNTTTCGVTSMLAPST